MRLCCYFQSVRQKLMTFKSNALTPMWISCQLQETDSTVTELSGSGRSTDDRPLMEHGRNLFTCLVCFSANDERPGS